MNPAKNGHDRLKIAEVAQRAGVSKNTLLRWLSKGLIEEPDRDWRGWRVWTEKEAVAVVGFANRIVPNPKKAQTALDV